MGSKTILSPIVTAGCCLVLSMLAYGQRSLQYNFEYRCNGERVVVSYCRRDGDQPGMRPTPDGANYCHVTYPDRPKPAGITITAVELRGEIEKKLQSCGALATPEAAASQTSASLKFNGLYVYDRDPTGPRSWLRFYEDGSVVSVSTQGASPENVWALSQFETKSPYTIRGSVIDFFIQFKTLDGKIGKITYSGTIGNNSLNLNFHSLVNGNRGVSNYSFVPLTGGATSSTTGGGTQPTAAAKTPAQLRLEEGIKFYNSKDYAKALASFKEANRLDPLFADAVHHTGIAYYQLKQYSKALFEFTAAIRLKYVNAHFSQEWIGDIHSELNEYEKALAAYSNSLKLKPDRSKTTYKVGNALFYLKRYDEAAAAYQNAIKLEPTNAVYHAALGGAYITGSRDCEKAIPPYREAVRLDANNATALYNLGTCYYRLQRSADAVPLLEKAVRLNPDNALYLNNLGFVYLKLGRKNDALAVHKKLATLDPASAKELLVEINKALK